MVHGFGTGTYTFARNVPELGKRHRVFAVDLIGQGASWPCSRPQKGDGLEYSLDSWTDQLACFIRDVVKDDNGVYIAGNSLGGLLALSLAYRHPEARYARAYVQCRAHEDLRGSRHAGLHLFTCRRSMHVCAHCWAQAAQQQAMTAACIAQRRPCAV
jgi:pimeloyl-ACP methyl ester carboxylesterase